MICRRQRCEQSPPESPTMGVTVIPHRCNKIPGKSNLRERKVSLGNTLHPSHSFDRKQREMSAGAQPLLFQLGPPTTTRGMALSTFKVGLLSSVNPLWKHPQRQAWRSISQGITLKIRSCVLVQLKVYDVTFIGSVAARSCELMTVQASQFSS